MSEQNSQSRTSPAVWAALIIAIIALIMVIIVYIFYFTERNEFLKQTEVEWNVVNVDPSSKNVDGKNFTLYVVPSTFPAGGTITLNSPTGGAKPGQWFAITNQNDKAVNVVAGTGVALSSFPLTSSTPTPSTPSVLPSKGSWILAWSGTSSLINLIPGQGIAQVS